MDIRLGQKKSDYRQLGDFLQAIVVNKSMFWTIHFGDNLQAMRRVGVGIWAEMQSRRELSESWAKVKKRHHWSSEYDVISGGTKSQATIRDGDIEYHATGRGNILTNVYPADWKPLRGESGWVSEYNDRPFYELNKRDAFWRPGSYIHPQSCDMTIWRSNPDGEVSLTEAKKCLYFTTNRCKQILSSRAASRFLAGSWKKGKLRGALARWH